MPLKVKRQFPYTEREFNVRTSIDDRFDVADRKFREAGAQITKIAEEAVVHTAKKLLAAARLFNSSDPSVAFLAGGLTKFIRDKDHVSLQADLKAFISANPINQFSHGTPEHGLVYACILMVDACLNIKEDNPESAYRNTVRTRFALRFVGE